MAGYLIGLVASAFFVWILIEPLGLIGVACGALLGQLAHSASEIAFSYRVYPLRFELKRPLAMLVITAIGGATIQLVVMPDLQQEIALRVVVLAAVAGLLWLVTFRAGGTPDQSTGSA
jgi:hypothetical protein